MSITITIDIEANDGVFEMAKFKWKNNIKQNKKT